MQTCLGVWLNTVRLISDKRVDWATTFIYRFMFIQVIFKIPFFKGKTYV